MKKLSVLASWLFVKEYSVRCENDMQWLHEWLLTNWSDCEVDLTILAFLEYFFSIGDAFHDLVPFVQF